MEPVGESDAPVLHAAGGKMSDVGDGDQPFGMGAVSALSVVSPPARVIDVRGMAAQGAARDRRRRCA
ncbi:hypothetical protein B7R77_23270 [Ralstonia solanacearum K60]|uniref:Uncharacterized protein n=1 Tax=Ralstonia solanacearum K60 TaxID=1091042 RepID=A0AAP7ZIN7_RALSL|nr:hypothetical protein BH759_02555 [Ralstonia solanacearum]OYQ09765.1 hypothetical protein B7R77_23270 [Ralstonia solanacearum K60]RIJ84183.1 hypothetical protein RSP822_22325 [Ralstonia solanacearum]